jgi:hypothetical protein
MGTFAFGLAGLFLMAGCAPGKGNVHRATPLGMEAVFYGPTGKDDGGRCDSGLTTDSEGNLVAGLRGKIRAGPVGLDEVREDINRMLTAMREHQEYLRVIAEVRSRNSIRWISQAEATLFTKQEGLTQESPDPRCDPGVR